MCPSENYEAAIVNIIISTNVMQQSKLVLHFLWCKCVIVFE